MTERRIKTIAICAGAGGSFFGSVTADAFFTGEMSHHEVLAAVAKGSNVILCKSIHFAVFGFLSLIHNIRRTY